jgi:radical SAM protein with 4Fe4S-binding SPASM domain
MDPATPMRDKSSTAKRFTNQVERARYVLRHLRTMLPYINVRKLFNLGLNFLELRFKIPSPLSLPPLLKIEPTPQCQLRCTGCWHKDVEFKRQFTSKDTLTLEDFRKILDPIAKTTLGISISLRGEPLLNKHLPALIRYAHDKRIATTLPTNLAMPISAVFARQLVNSGLDTLYISLDGASEETYRLYRVGGNFHRVLANVRLLADTKRELGNTRLRLIWKMVVFDHNCHEIPTQEEKYREYGFDGFERVVDNHSDTHAAIVASSNRQMIESKAGCFWLWNTAVITSDGEVRPCCTHESFELGNAVDQDFRHIWRGAPYRKLRRAFSSNKYGEGMHPVCAKCIGLSDPSALVSIN